LSLYKLIWPAYSFWEYADKEKDKDARIAKLPGRWSGRIHVDEISDVDLEETNLDTQQSVKRRVNTEKQGHHHQSY